MKEQVGTADFKQNPTTRSQQLLEKITGTS